MFQLIDQMVSDRRMRLSQGPRVRRLPAAALAQVVAVRLAHRRPPDQTPSSDLPFPRQTR